MKRTTIFKRTLSLCLVLITLFTVAPMSFASYDDLTAEVVTVNLKKYKKLNPSHAEASSEMTWGTKRYHADNVLDGSKSTTWREGVKGHGIGESITIFFKKEETISIIRIYPGYQAKQSGFYNNSRPSEMTLTFSDGSSCSIELDDKVSGPCYELSIPVTTDFVEFTIDSVYKGRKSTDTCISEIEFYG